MKYFSATILYIGGEIQITNIIHWVQNNSSEKPYDCVSGRLNVDVKN